MRDLFTNARPADRTPSGGAAAVHRRGWLRRLAAFADHRHSTWVLAAVAFADSSFLPVPPDLLLVPMCLMRPERLRFLMAVCTLASSLGAVLGYLIGWTLWTTIGSWLIDFYGLQQSFAAYQQLVARWGISIIIVKGFTPVPFKIAAIAAGVGGMNFWAFMAATVVGRALHFAMLAALLLLFGARITALLTRYERPLAVLSVAAVLAAALVFYLR